jgi:hypothetical protein
MKIKDLRQNKQIHLLNRKSSTADKLKGLHLSGKKYSLRSDAYSDRLGELCGEPLQVVLPVLKRG